MGDETTLPGDRPMTTLFFFSEPVHIYAETSTGETKSGYIRTCRLPGARTGSPFEVLLARRARVSASAMTDSTSIATRAR